MLTEDFTKEEVEQAKSGWLQWRGVSRAQDNELVGNIAHYLFVGRTLAWDAELEKKVMALDAAQIRAALQRHVVPAKFTVVKAGDSRAPRRRRRGHRRPWQKGTRVGWHAPFGACGDHSGMSPPKKKRRHQGAAQFDCFVV